jgi:hypothetical protein
MIPKTARERHAVRYGYDQPASVRGLCAAAQTNRIDLAFTSDFNNKDYAGILAAPYEDKNKGITLDHSRSRHIFILAIAYTCLGD